MRADARVYDLFALLLTYPDHRYLAWAEECRDALNAKHGDTVRDIEGFIDLIGGLTTHELEELYTVTFDLNPVCSLEVGWHLYGDTYNRGEFLVRVRQMLRECAVAESSELPDHLAHMLPLLPRLDPGEASALIVTSVVPAVAKMRKALGGGGNPFERLLNAVSRVLEVDLPAVTSAVGADVDAVRQPPGP
jgi:nitrate reductase molybdenum cofactor assembly chaperone NarJ/NarW